MRYSLLFFIIYSVFVQAWIGFWNSIFVDLGHLRHTFLFPFWKTEIYCHFAVSSFRRFAISCFKHVPRMTCHHATNQSACTVQNLNTDLRPLSSNYREEFYEVRWFSSQAMAEKHYFGYDHETLSRLHENNWVLFTCLRLYAPKTIDGLLCYCYVHHSY